jgi:EAL and modified HD-GYP domain-containing signal transduction protein
MSSPERSILSHIALGYTPLIDRHRVVSATRLTVMPLRPDARLSATDLLACISQTWPEGGRDLVLKVLSESLLSELLQSSPPRHLLIEVPAFMATQPALAPTLQALHRQGHKLLLQGRAHETMDAAQRACFKFSTLDLQDEAQGDAHLPRLMSGLRGAAAIDACFARGATGVMAWPMEGAFDLTPQAAHKPEIHTDLQVIVELMSRVDQGEDIDRLEQTLTRDPSLAFKLLRYLNSAAFGLPVEVSSFHHAIMLLGYPRLKRWLALLLTTASKDHSMRPVMFGALRRGLLMEELAKGVRDADLHDEMFICGLFSLLDHMLHQPFDKLLQSIPVPERVRQALVDEGGPYQPYLELVRAIEHESVFEYRSAAEQLMLSAEEINQGVLKALARAAQLE